MTDNQHIDHIEKIAMFLKIPFLNMFDGTNQVISLSIYIYIYQISYIYICIHIFDSF